MSFDLSPATTVALTSAEPRSASAARSNRPRKSWKRACLECGDSFQAFQRHGQFCSSTHRKDWNNRRMVRGSELYDLFMICRHERGLAKAKGYWNLMCRMAAEWRFEDERDRAGRKSWVADDTALADRCLPYAATVIDRGFLHLRKK